MVSFAEMDLKEKELTIVEMNSLPESCLTENLNYPTSLKGFSLALPGAYIYSEPTLISQFINYLSCWEEPSDLTESNKRENLLIKQYV